MFVTMRLGLKDPSFPTTPTNFVTVQKYHVKFTRADGGPVPASFDGGAMFTVTESHTSSGPIVLVPAQAIVADFLQTFKEFPPRAKAASFSIDQAMEKLMPRDTAPAPRETRRQPVKTARHEMETAQ